MKLTITQFLFIVSITLSIKVINAQKLNFTPYIPAYKTNPYTSTMWNGLNLKNPPTTFSFADFGELYLASNAYMHPQSPYFMDSLVYNRLISLLDSFLTNWSQGNNLVNAAMQMPTCYAYCMLKTLYPAKIPSNKKGFWEAAIKRSIDSTISQNPGLFIDKKVGATWLNGHYDEVAGVFFGANALGDSATQAQARYIIEKVFTKCLLKDGGTHYLGYSNEAPTYHPLVVSQFLQYWLNTGSPDVLKVLKGMGHYPNLITHFVAGNTTAFTEWSTAPAAKAYYNNASETYPSAVAMWLENDGYNQAKAIGATGYELAFIYDSSLVIKKFPAPTDFMLFDSNSYGPRGRFGPWGIVGTTRDNSSALPDHPDEQGYIGQGDGLNTFVGAYILDTVQTGKNKNPVPINAAFQGAGVQVKWQKGINDDWSRGGTYDMLAIKAHNSITKSNSIYSISTKHFLSYRGVTKTIPWNGMQQWVLTKDRLIGMMEIKSLATQKVYGMGAHLTLVSGRKAVNLGTQKAPIAIDKYTYTYGQLKTKVQSENFHGDITPQYFGIFLAPDSLSIALNLHDSLDNNNDSLITYPAGTQKYVLWEVTYGNKSYSTANVVKTSNNSLVGFQFTEQLGRKARMVHNTDSIAQTYTDTMFCPFAKASIHQSWDDSVKTLSTGVDSLVRISLTIPPYGHILLINSGMDSDHIAGFNTYNSVFTTPIPLPTSLLNLKASSEGKTNKIIWETNTEKNNSRFVIQHSTNGTSFTDIGTVKANGTGVNEYTFTDNNPSNGTNYYRIITIDNNGKSSFSKVVSVGFISNQTFSIVPNPAKNYATLLFNKTIEKAILTVYDFSGRAIVTKLLNSGGNSYRLNTQTLSNGTYVVKVRSAVGDFNEKLLIKK